MSGISFHKGGSAMAKAGFPADSSGGPLRASVCSFTEWNKIRPEKSPGERKATNIRTLMPGHVALNFVWREEDSVLLPMFSGIGLFCSC